MEISNATTPHWTCFLSPLLFSLSCWNKERFSQNLCNNVSYLPKDVRCLFQSHTCWCVSVDMHGVRLCADFCCLYLNFFLIGSPNSSCQRQRSHTNQLTVLALFNTPRHRRGRRESKQTPITVRHEEGDHHVWALFVIMCLLLYLQTKQEGQWSCVHREDMSIGVRVFVLYCEEWASCWV